MALIDVIKSIRSVMASKAKPVTVIHVERRKRPSPCDDTHKALAASLRDGRVEYLPTAREISARELAKNRFAMQAVEKVMRTPRERTA